MLDVVFLHVYKTNDLDYMKDARASFSIEPVFRINTAILKEE